MNATQHIAYNSNSQNAIALQNRRQLHITVSIIAFFAFVGIICLVIGLALGRKCWFCFSFHIFPVGIALLAFATVSVFAGYSRYRRTQGLIIQTVNTNPNSMQQGMGPQVGYGAQPGMVPQAGIAPQTGYAPQPGMVPQAWMASQAGYNSLPGAIPQAGMVPQHGTVPQPGIVTHPGMVPPYSVQDNNAVLPAERLQQGKDGTTPDAPPPSYETAIQRDGLC